MTNRAVVNRPSDTLTHLQQIARDHPHMRLGKALERVKVLQTAEALRAEKPRHGRTSGEIDPMQMPIAKRISAVFAENFRRK